MVEKLRILHKDVRKIEIETLNHRITAEYFIPTDVQDIYGIILLSPDIRYCKSGMYFSLIENLFRLARKNNIAAMRIEFQTSDTYTEAEVLNQYITQTSVSIDHFKDIIGKYKKLIIVGISGGAYIAMQMLLRRIELSGAILMSPHMLHYRFDDFITHYTTHMHLIYRSNDKYIPIPLLKTFEEVCNKYGLITKSTDIVANDDSYNGKEEEIWNIIMDMLTSIEEDTEINEETYSMNDDSLISDIDTDVE